MLALPLLSLASVPAFDPAVLSCLLQKSDASALMGEHTRRGARGSFHMLQPFFERSSEAHIVEPA